MKKQRKISVNKIRLHLARRSHFSDSISQFTLLLLRFLLSPSAVWGGGGGGRSCWDDPLHDGCVSTPSRDESRVVVQVPDSSYVTAVPTIFMASSLRKLQKITQTINRWTTVLQLSYRGCKYLQFKSLIVKKVCIQV